MPFTINDFEDLVRLLYQHPEYRERLRSLILPEDFVTLPQLVRENTEAIRRLEEAVAQLVEFQRRAYEEFQAYRQQTDAALRELAEAQKRTEQRVEELAEAQKRTDETVARLSQRVEELAEAQKRTEQRVEELAEAQKRTEQRVEELAEAQKRTEQRVEELAEAQKRTEQRVEELAEAQKRTEQRVEELAEAQKRTEQRVEELAEAQKRTQEEFYAYRTSTDARLDRLEQRVDNLASQVGQLVNIIGATLEEEAQASVSTLIRQKGYKAEPEGYPVRIDSVGEIDVVLPVESPTGERLTVVAESKARLSRRAVTDWANRMNSPDFRRKLKEAGVQGPYLVYMYAIRVDPAALDEARKLGIGIMSGRGELVEPAGALPEEE
ncbi:MAG: hypothetical protein HPY54_08040 [Chthonomonadetes bacterium]|nr:hypothetical protein [Chthonomonadetes bacterium]